MFCNTQRHPRIRCWKIFEADVGVSGLKGSFRARVQDELKGAVSSVVHTKSIPANIGIAEDFWFKSILTQLRSCSWSLWARLVQLSLGLRAWGLLTIVCRKPCPQKRPKTGNTCKNLTNEAEVPRRSNRRGSPYMKFPEACPSSTPMDLHECQAASPLQTRRTRPKSDVKNKAKARPRNEGLHSYGGQVLVSGLL